MREGELAEEIEKLEEEEDVINEKLYEENTGTMAKKLKEGEQEEMIEKRGEMLEDLKEEERD